MNTEEAIELLVALPHDALLLQSLQEAGVDRTVEVIDTSDDLGLARLSLTYPAATADRVRTWYEKVKQERRSDADPAPTDVQRPALDRILGDLRAGLAARNAGWVPTMGKNRLVGRVPGMRTPRPGVGAGGEEVSHGGGGAPRAIDEPAWAKARSHAPGRGVRVGILDTALRRHDYLGGAWVGDYEDGLDYPDRLPAEAGHATFVSGLVLRHAPGAILQVSKLLDDEGSADSWTAALKIVELGHSGIDILNLSFVSYTDDGAPPLVLSAAIDRLDPEILVVAAAGNHGYLRNGEQRKAAWPAALDDVVAVGASTGDGQRADFTPKGSWVDVLAPGQDLESTYLHKDVLVWQDPDGDGPQDPERRVRTFRGYAQWSGTSFAAAALSGAIAAQTVPGRVTARQAYASMVEQARRAPVKQGRRTDPLLIDPGAPAIPAAA